MFPRATRSVRTTSPIITVRTCSFGTHKPKRNNSGVVSLAAAELPARYLATRAVSTSLSPRGADFRSSCLSVRRERNAVIGTGGVPIDCRELRAGERPGAMRRLNVSLFSDSTDRAPIVARSRPSSPSTAMTTRDSSASLHESDRRRAPRTVQRSLGPTITGPSGRGAPELP